MREAQLDKVYNGGFKCHSAGPDISLFDMESEWERWSSQGELISTSENNKFSPVTKLRGREGRRRHFRDIHTQQRQLCPLGALQLASFSFVISPWRLACLQDARNEALWVFKLKGYLVVKSKMTHDRKLKKTKTSSLVEGEYTKTLVCQCYFSTLYKRRAVKECPLIFVVNSSIVCSVLPCNFV